MASAVASSASSNQAPQAASSANESFLECHRPRVMKAMDEHSGINIRDLAKIVAEYAVKGEIFGYKEYEKYFGVQTEQIEIDDGFYQFWFAPDALDPTKLNCATHFPPILIPQTVTKSVSAAYRHRFARDVDRIDFSLETLGKLAEKPLQGNPSRYRFITVSLIQNEKTKPKAVHFVVARKEVFARGLSVDKQEEASEKAGYGGLSSALDLATVSFVHHLVTGERYLGDDTGMEKRYTASRSKDTVQYDERSYPVVVGYHEPLVPGVVGGPGPSGGLRVFLSGFVNVGNVCVAGLRKFSGH